MVSHAIQKAGSRNQKDHWLPQLAAGKLVAAFALTEPEAGSDAGSVKSFATALPDCYVLNGRKKWITYGQIADVFLIFAQCDRQVSAFLVDRNTPGLCVKPIFGMLGLRASMLAELEFNNCRIPKENLIGRIGSGFSFIASSALNQGRYSVACGCVGIAEGCLQASISYVNRREQYGTLLKEHQLVQQMLANMITSVKAARLLCRHAGYLHDTGQPSAIMETTIAKYFAATTAYKAAGDAVQLHGANGCSSLFPVQRYLRDSKIMEIIEGSTQIQQVTIGRYAAEMYESFLAEAAA
jgi:alkylation response protein AidB-like acyl-CoA dehydrogenase